MKLNKQKKEKMGFTLIELLAVIVILSVISIIAVPKIIDLIEKSSQSASIDSAKLYIKAVNQQISFNELDQVQYPFVASGTYDVKEIKKYINIKGYYPDSGNIEINQKVLSADLCINKYNIIYDGNKYNLTSDSKCGKSVSDDTSLDNFHLSEYKIKDTTEFNYTGDYQEFVAQQDGFYKFELWGAGGGEDNWNSNLLSNQGRGAYTSGVTYLKKGTKFYVYVGQKGTHGITDRNTLTSTSFNGGGAGMGSSDGDDGGGAGGGATDIRLVSGSWDNFESLKSRIMVAGGGAGGSTVSYNFSKISAGSGGFNGIGSSWRYQNIENPNHSFNATQTTGYKFGIGENGTTVGNAGGSGAGGGYYGGLKSTDSPSGGAGGGSSYISGYNGCNSIDKKSTEDNIIHTGDSKHYSEIYFVESKIVDGTASVLSGTSNITTGNKNDGYAKISLLEKGNDANISNKLYLYKDGSINNTVTIGRVHQNYTVDLKDNYIYTYNCGIKFNNKIDLTNYSHINFDVQNTTKNGYARYYISSDNIDINAVCSSGYCVQDSENGIRKTISIDVSNLNGEYYIYQNDYFDMGTNIYNIWLD